MEKVRVVRDLTFTIVNEGGEYCFGRHKKTVLTFTVGFNRWQKGFSHLKEENKLENKKPNPILPHPKVPKANSVLLPSILYAKTHTKAKIPKK